MNALKYTIVALLLGMASFSLHAQKTLPQFEFFTLDGKSFTHSNLQAGLPTVVMFFDPYCDHCAKQADWIQAKADEFAGIQLVFVTTEPEASATQEFQEKHFGGTSLKHLHFLQDKNFYFDTYFGYSEVPSMYLYDKNGERIKDLHKEVEADKLLGYFEGK
ncbi:MAG: redoxin domain-containing protein [Bacteroidota bacterium]